MYRSFKRSWLVFFWPVLILAAFSFLLVFSSWALQAAKRRPENIKIVDKSLENMRDEPNGKKIGSLLKGTEIEEIGREGNWVRFRVEGWVWGPALEGFEEENEKHDETEETSERPPLLEYLPKIKRLINDEYGVFYGIHIDKDFGRLEVRLRVRDLEPEALTLRQQALQVKVLENLANASLEFDVVRIESNRHDGSGQVGVVMAETAVEAIKEYGDGPVEEWKSHSRFSADGGETWSP